MQPWHVIVIRKDNLKARIKLEQIDTLCEEPELQSEGWKQRLDLSGLLFQRRWLQGPVQGEDLP